MAGKKNGLTAKQLLFRERWLEHRDQQRAYKEAGYTGKDPRNSASLLMSTPWMREARAALEKAAFAGIEAAKDRAKEVALAPVHALERRENLSTWLAQIAAGEVTLKKTVPVKDPGTGQVDMVEVEITPDFSEMLKAADTLAKLHGWLTIKKEIKSDSTRKVFVHLDNGRGPAPARLPNDVQPILCGTCGKVYTDEHVCSQKELTS